MNDQQGLNAFAGMFADKITTGTVEKIARDLDVDPWEAVQSAGV